MVGQAAGAELPSCPVCCETLGRWGGPATLPCGHNGCLDCFAAVQARNPQCPLCRYPFDRSTKLSCNYELADLIKLATAMFIDESTQQEGWEAFPSTKLTAESYASELVKGRAGGKLGAPEYHLGEQRAHEELQPSIFDEYNGHGLDEEDWPSAPELPEDHHGAGPSTSLVPWQPPAGPVAGRPGGNDMLSLEPPQWLPDSQAAECLSCHLAFRPFTRLRHHCRMCGKIFCYACCHKKALLPPKYGKSTPQRTCELCSSALAPHQQALAATLAAAAQSPVQDAPDSISLRAWLNAPWTSRLEEDVFKAANMLQSFVRASRLQPEVGLPTAVLQGAAALALLSVVKVGAGWSLSFGTGLMVARLPSGGWSAPCAVAAGGVGWGLQLGGELVDVLLVLRSREALTGICSGLRTGLGVGGHAAVALGPMGRHADATMLVGASGTAAAYSYSCSKGAFLGVSLEGSMLYARDQVNENFYGYSVTPRQLLLEGAVPQPPAAVMLYSSLQALTDKYENRRLLVHPPPGSSQRHHHRCRRLSTGSIASSASGSVAMTANGYTTHMAPSVMSRVMSSRPGTAAGPIMD